MSVTDALPVYHHRERHSLRVDASPDAALAAARETRLDDVPLVSALFRLRGLRAAPRGPIWVSMQAQGFRLHDPETLVLIGRPWSPRGGIRPAADFIGFTEPGYAKMAVDLRALPDGDGARLETETRVFLTDASSRRRFAVYWLAIRPFSGLDPPPLAPRREAPGRALTRTCSVAPAVVSGDGYESSRSRPRRRRSHLRRALPRASRRRLPGGAARAWQRARRRGCDAGRVRGRLSRGAARDPAAVAARVVARHLRERAQTPLPDGSATPARAGSRRRRLPARRRAAARAVARARRCARSPAAGAAPRLRAPRDRRPLLRRDRRAGRLDRRVDSDAALPGTTVAARRARAADGGNPTARLPAAGAGVARRNVVSGGAREPHAACRRGDGRDRAHRRRRERRRPGPAGGRARRCPGGRPVERRSRGQAGRRPTRSRSPTLARRRGRPQPCARPGSPRRSRAPRNGRGPSRHSRRSSRPQRGRTQLLRRCRRRRRTP